MATLTVKQPRTNIGLLLDNQKFVIGILIFLILLALALVGNLFFETEMRTSGSLPARQPPGEAGLLGSDSLGRSIATLLDQGSQDPATDLAGLLREVGIPFVIDAEGVPQLT